MTQQPEQRQVQATVESVAAARGDQVQIKAKIPEIGANQYGITLFIPEAAPHQAGATYNAVIQKGDLKQGKTGEWDTDFFWNAVSWEGRTIERGQRQAPAQQAPAAAPQSPVQAQSVSQGRVTYEQPATGTVPIYVEQPAPTGDPRQNSIEAQVALKAAVDLVIAYPPQAAEGLSTLSAVGTVQNITDIFRRLLASPLEPEQAPEEDPPVPQDTDAPEEGMPW